MPLPFGLRYFGTPGAGPTPQPTPAGTPTPGKPPGEDGPKRSAQRDLPRRTPTLAYPEDRWENWWLSSQDRFLDLDRRYAAAAAPREPSRDSFLGAVTTDPHPVLRNAAMARDRVVPLLLQLAQHESAAVRAEAALALGKVGGAEHVTVLGPLIGDRHPDVRHHALLGLGLLDGVGARGLLASLLSDARRQDADRVHAALGLAVLGDVASLPTLLTISRESGLSRELEAALLLALAAIPHDVARETLRECAEDVRRPQDLRAVAVWGLGRSSHLEDFDLFERALRDPGVDIRRSAALALGHIGSTAASSLATDSQAAQRLLERLTGGARRSLAAELEARRLRTEIEDERRRRVALRAVEALTNALHRDADLPVRGFSALALGRLGGTEAQRALAEALRRGRSSSELAFVALGAGLAGGDASSALVRRALAVRGGDPSLRSALCLSAGLARDRECAELLLDLASSRHSELRPAAAIAFGLVGVDIEGARSRLRAEVDHRRHSDLWAPFAMGLGLLGDRSALISLRSLVLDGSNEDRLLAASALSMISDLESLEILAVAAEDPSVEDTGLAAIVHALGRLADRGTVPGLEPLRRDWNYLLAFPAIQRAILQ